MTASLQGSRALVTGGGRGIGLAVVRELVARGARTLAADLADVLGDWTGPEEAELLELDVNDPDARRALAHRLDRLDVLVNNAGIHLERAFGDVDEEDWSRVMDVNLRAPYFLCQALLPALSRSRAASIVNVASTSAYVASPGQSVYEISKAGVAMMTRSLAAELAPRGIRVNAVAPGLIDTRMSRSLFPTDEAMQERALDRSPSRRPGRPEEVARAVAFLASPDSSYVIGHVMLVDGGWMLQ